MKNTVSTEFCCGPLYFPDFSILALFLMIYFSFVLSMKLVLTTDAIDMAEEILDAVCFVVKDALSCSGWLSELTVEKDYANLCLSLKLKKWIEINNGKKQENYCPEMMSNEYTPGTLDVSNGMAKMNEEFISKIDPDSESLDNYCDNSSNLELYSEQSSCKRLNKDILEPLTFSQQPFSRELNKDTNEKSTEMKPVLLTKTEPNDNLLNEPFEYSSNPTLCSNLGSRFSDQPSISVESVGVEISQGSLLRQRKKVDDVNTWNGNGMKHKVGRPKKRSFKKEKKTNKTITVQTKLTDALKVKDVTSLSCTRCNYKAPSKSKLERHQTTHSTEKPFACSLCEFRAKRKEELTRHRSKHTGEKPYHCNLCNYEGRDPTGLRSHMLTHSGEKKHACQHCKYTSIRKANLKIHVEQVHNTIDLIQCGLCSFQTINKIKYRSHIIGHTTNRAFTCTACDKTFLIKSDYATHMKIHQPKAKAKDYPCPICVVRLTSLKDKDQHMTQEHGMIGHKCRLCASIFTRFPHLKKHHKNKHPDEAIYHCSLCHFNSDDGREYRSHLTNVAHLEKVAKNSGIC